MFQKGFFLSACILAITASASSDETNRSQEIQDQRVSPKLLKESLALQKTQETVPDVLLLDSLVPVSLEELTQLATKLRSDGDLASAELLERYVREQKSTTAKNDSTVPIPHITATSAPIWIEIEAFEVNGNDIPIDSVLKSYATAQDIRQIREELGRMVVAKKATITIPLQTLQTKLNQAVNYVEKLGEIEIPVPDGIPNSVKREAAIKAEITAKLKSTGMIELKQIIDVSRFDEKNSVQFDGKLVPGLKSNRIQSVNETIVGQPVLLAHFCGLFVFTTVNPKLTDVSLAPSGVHK